MFNYYEAPKQGIFDEVKQKSIAVWKTYNNDYGYVDEKVGRIKGIENIGDNAWYIIAMFDASNRENLIRSVNAETRAAILEMLSEVKP